MSAIKKSAPEELLEMVLDEATQSFGQNEIKRQPSMDDDKTLPITQNSIRKSNSGEEESLVDLGPLTENKSVSFKPGHQSQVSHSVSQPSSHHNVNAPTSVPPSTSSMPRGDKSFGASSGQLGEFGLRQSEHLRIAQTKINDLEEEMQRLRKENEKLAAAGETYKRLKEELSARLENTSRDRDNEKTIFHEESKILKERLTAKEKQNSESQRQIEELEIRLDTNLRKIRKREKDLEHRLEIARLEGSAVVRSKDEVILSLKRRIDQLESEAENYSKKSQVLYKRLQSKQDDIRRVVKALRIALSQLEGDDEDQDNLKKVD